MRPPVFLFVNNKGGVGKTTLLREIAFYLALRGKRVLMVDCDQQANLTYGITEEPEEEETIYREGLYEALEENKIVFQEIRENLFLLSGDKRLAVLEKRLSEEDNTYRRLKLLLEKEVFHNFDIIFLDTPPGLGTFSINAMAASDSVVIPMPPAVYTMQGANDLVESINKVRKQLNSKLKVFGVIVNSFDSRPKVFNEIREEIEEGFGPIFFSTYLSRSSKVEDAIKARKGIIEMKAEARTLNKQVRAIGKEFMERLEAVHG